MSKIIRQWKERAVFLIAVVSGFILICGSIVFLYSFIGKLGEGFSEFKMLASIGSSDRPVRIGPEYVSVDRLPKDDAESNGNIESMESIAIWFDGFDRFEHARRRHSPDAAIAPQVVEQIQLVDGIEIDGLPIGLRRQNAE